MCVHINVHMHLCSTYAVYALQRCIGVRMHIHINVHLHRCHILAVSMVRSTRVCMHISVHVHLCHIFADMKC